MTQRHFYLWLGLGAAVLLLFINEFVYQWGLFPAGWNFGLGAFMDEIRLWVVTNRLTHPLFLYFFEPLRTFIDALILTVERFLIRLPWPVVVTAVFILAHRLANLRRALVMVFCTVAMGALGFWAESMATLALMLISVIISLIIGIPLGIWSARNNRVEQVLRPFLDAMQTLPAFVYLVPVVLFFGVARVPGVIATIIYALPPAIRLTNLGLRRVPADVVEAAQSFGTTDRQMLLKIQLPLAMPAIMAGVNQTIMMALGIVVIAAMIGAGGLGYVVLSSLRRLLVGEAFSAGLAIVFMAILLDRMSYALSDIRHSSQPAFQGYRFFSNRWRGRRGIEQFEQGLAWLYGRGQTFLDQCALYLPTPLRPLTFWLVSFCFLLVLGLVLSAAGVKSYPAEWKIPLSQPIDAMVLWMQTNLYQMGDGSWGTYPFSEFISLRLLAPLRLLLTEQLPWPVIVVLFAVLAYQASNWRLVALTIVCFLLIGFLGMWALAMDTLSQVLVAVLVSVVIGVPWGVLASQSAGANRVTRLMMDFLQTIPPFVYLVPVIMLFSIGRVPGIIASVLYALPPAVRLTNLGLRQIDPTIIEAAEAFGSTNWQILLKVRLPLALTTIMLGINQTIMSVLSMVIIAGLVGGQGLGFEVVVGLAQNELGRSTEAGLAIVLLAIVLDRITQAWAEKM